MSRNVREEEAKVLHILKKCVPEERRGQIVNVKREVFFSEKTYNVIDKASIFISDAIDGWKIALIKLENVIYICMNEDLYTPGILQTQNEVANEEILHGIGILLVNREILKIKTAISGYRIYDMFFAFSDEKKYSCQDVFEVFEDYRVFEITDKDFSMQYTEDLNRILCMLLLKLKSNLYGEKFYQNLFDVLTLESSRSIIPMISAILQTTNYDLIFLQLYRCIEYLYIIQKALYLSEEYDIKKERILKLLNLENLHWQEVASMRIIISTYCSEEIIDEYYNYFLEKLDIQQCKPENKTEKVADYIYETRCKIAHFKYGQTKLKDSKTLHESNSILCCVVKDIFQKLDDEIVNINNTFQLWDMIEK